MRFLRWLRAVWARFVPVGAAWLPGAGVVLLVLALAVGVRPWRVAHAGIRTQATVVENVAAVGGDGALVYSPRFVFRARDQRLVTVLSRSLNSVDSEAVFAVGQVVPVVYAAANPQEALIVSIGQMYMPTILIGVLGVALFDVGWVLRLVLRRRQGAGE